MITSTVAWTDVVSTSVYFINNYNGGIILSFLKLGGSILIGTIVVAYVVSQLHK